MVMGLLQWMFGGETMKTLEPNGLAKPQIKQGETVVTKHSPHAKIVEEIHQSFAIAAEQALTTAKEVLATKSQVDNNKANLLRQAGFLGTAEVQAQDEEKEVKAKAKGKADIVMKYQLKYPQYKFIFKYQVEAICQKYGLVCGPIQRYKGDVPIKNLKEITNFTLHTADIWMMGRTSFHFNDSDPFISTWRLQAYQDVANSNTEGKVCQVANKYISRGDGYTGIGFSICAPKSDMNMEGMEMKGSFMVKQEIPDPIVLYPQPKDGGYLIVSAWGPEASDEDIVNQKMN